MKTLIFLVSLLFLCGFLVFAQNQQYQGYVPNYGNYLSNQGDRLQTYEQYVPKYGDYWQRQGDRWQHYKGFVPNYGTWINPNGQVYKGYVPDFGDYFD
jgi:hypothetical protein